MGLFAVNYTLMGRSPKDYKNLIAAIKGASDGNYLHCLDSLWLISSNGSARDIYNHLAQCMRKGDFLLVQGVTREFACSLPKDSVDWLKSFLKHDLDPVISTPMPPL